MILHFVLFINYWLFICCAQVARNKSKKGGIQKRVYAWGGISWHAKTRLHTWTAAEAKSCIWRHTKRLMVGTVFMDDDIVWRVTESRHREQRFGTTDVIRYCNHFDHLGGDPVRDECEVSSYDDVKAWHADSHAKLALESTLKLPTVGQDTDNTLQIYREFLYPVMRRERLKHLVEDNESPHNSECIREAHRAEGVVIVGYEATEAEKREIARLIEVQTRAYRRPQDRQAQLTKQTRELRRLPAWPPNSPDLNLIEVVWSWVVKKISNRAGGWPKRAQELRESAV